MYQGGRRTKARRAGAAGAEHVRQGVRHVRRQRAGLRRRPGVLRHLRPVPRPDPPAPARRRALPPGHHSGQRRGGQEIRWPVLRHQRQDHRVQHPAPAAGRGEAGSLPGPGLRPGGGGRRAPRRGRPRSGSTSAGSGIKSGTPTCVPTPWMRRPIGGACRTRCHERSCLP